MKILLDMNVPIRYKSLLEARGIEVLRWSDAGAADASDTEIMMYARSNNFIVLTFDLDFSAILSATHELKPSVIQVRASVLQAEQVMKLVVVALFQYRDALEKGAILSIGSKKVRLRFLPL